MIQFHRQNVIRAVAAASFFCCLGIIATRAQQPDESSVIRGVDAAVKARIDGIAGYTVTEHYAVYRNDDETHPAAEMTVETLYRRNVGKNYTILSQSGSAILRKFVLVPLLDNEKTINLPGNVEKSWFTSANYQMKLRPGETMKLDGRDCLAVAMTPRQKAPNMIDGTLWVDAKDDSIVQIEGIASKSPSLFAGSTKMMRQYTNLSGFAMATHARAESNSAFFGQTVLTIDYRDYHIQVHPAE